LLMRQLIGVGTLRGLQGRLVAAPGALLTLIRVLWPSLTRHWPRVRTHSTLGRVSSARYNISYIGTREMAFTTNC
jgi:hypothetical protein